MRYIISHNGGERKQKQRSDYSSYEWQKARTTQINVQMEIWYVERKKTEYFVRIGKISNITIVRNGRESAGHNISKLGYWRRSFVLSLSISPWHSERYEQTKRTPKSVIVQENILQTDLHIINSTFDPDSGRLIVIMSSYTF